MSARRIALGLLLCAGMAAQSGQAAGDPGADTAAAFARLQALVGEWVTEDAKESLTYELVAGGTALIERETAPNRPTMLTLYHRDGNRLVLTHYCMVGNQPRMAARPFDSAKNELAFEFLDATNLASTAAGHMHGTTIRFVDANHIETEWQFYENGKATMTERARYARVR
jgi:hypothetical protein